MQYRDQYSQQAVRTSVVPQAIAAAKAGTAVDLAGAKSCLILASTGAFAGAEVISVKLQEADASGGPWSDVPAAYVQSDAPASLAASFSYRLGYLGGKRFVRPMFVWTSGTSAQVAALAVVEPLVRPVP
ncbi:hypothetical protein [Stagnihabitans tardus]|uniref:Uncharacterized protein n=1 Tax=Stagnihabitans tardus TaxID=2699202 RepID=A0AAE5BVM0_9RHOB|nr:hypothetical protein [Stagnihabitans tardus]NBZ87904.1 hypothetical protein [Stagnihabitans tardus]